MSYTIKIVTYTDDNGGDGFYRTFNARTIDSKDEAIIEAQALARRTGWCYGVFGPEGKVHDTSPYYAQFNLTEEVTS
jgi:hypothetical protein